MAFRRNYPITALILLLITAAFSSCADTEPSAADTEELAQRVSTALAATAAENERAISATPTSVMPINPLTGLPVSDPSRLERKPVFVKVSNHPPIGRPHAGLSFADIVFEYYIGSGQSRFMALFYGQDAIQIGPVRSGRRVDAEIVPMYGGVLGYGSADADTDAVIVNALGNYAISNLEGPCPAFCGEETHSITGVFANSAAISEFVDMNGWENKAPDLPGIAFQVQPPDSMQPAERLMILFNYYNRGEWRYDADSGKYLRWIEEVENYGTLEESMQMIPLVDRITGDQLAFENIIVMFAQYDELAPTAHAIEIRKNNDGRPAYLFRDGGLIKGEWATPNDYDPIQFTTTDGDPMPLKPGNTWIAIMGINSSWEEVQPGQWQSFFSLP
jgi:hypothetical protein